MEADYFNNTWLQFTGRGLQKETGTGWLSAIHPDDIDKFQYIFSQSFSKKEKFKTEYRLKRSDGQYRWVVSMGQPFFDLKGEFIGFLTAGYDIQELKDSQNQLFEMNDDLQEKNEELARAEEALKESNVILEEKIDQRTEELNRQNIELKRKYTDLDNFIYTASHDLRAPIANIEGLLTALRENLDSAQKQEILDFISESIRRFKRTIEDLTEISQAQKEIYAHHEVNISEILEEVLSILRNRIELAHAQIFTDILVPVIYFSRKNLRSVIFNLLSNAIKFRSSERPLNISVKTYTSNLYTVLEVSDNGVGIKKEHQEKIFQMFKRVHSHVEGTGIGLYIVKRIMENADGYIELESQEGVGTSFKLFFRQ
jgi:PAS domain S-box-containing protein